MCWTQIFTVYGPWGRPDMAYFMFTKKILEKKEISVFGNGQMWRDFTYIDDVVDAIEKIIKKFSNNFFRNDQNAKILNIGNNKPENLNTFIETIEKSLGIKAKKNFLDYQTGDAKRTSSNITNLQNEINFSPKTSIDEGIPRFVNWYKKFYNQNL